jgi:hypothetical protein
MAVDILGVDILQRDLREFALAARHLDFVLSQVELRARDKASLAAGVLAIERAIAAQAGRFSKSAEMRLIWKDLRETRVDALRKRFRKLAETELPECGRGRHPKVLRKEKAVTGQISPAVT